MNVPGSVPLAGLIGPAGQNTQYAGMSDQQIYEQKTIKWMQSAFESCPTKMAMAGVMGFGLGGMFGLFMSSMRYDTPMSSASATVTSLPLREQLRAGLKDMGKASWSSARNFGLVGAIFSGTECCIEGLRAKNELSNGVAAGCMTGAILARNSGPQGMAVGCAGFAAFSAAIDSYMRMPDNPGQGRID